METPHEFPGALPEIPAGWSAEQLDLLPGEGFWKRVEEIAIKGEMTRGLDLAMKGHSSPRIWLFLHPPGRGELSAAVAMSFARELAFRDQAALVLDGDDRNLALTRWAGRVEAEGWIDLARYGTSVLTSGVPMPFVGRRGYLLGVGSFAPTDVTGPEVDTLVTRLRRQADDLLIVAPADSLGRLWAPAAGIRVLCWDRHTMSPADAAEVAAGFAEADCPVTAVVSFEDSGASAEELVEDVLTEVAPPPAAKPVAVAGPEDETLIMSASDLPDLDEEPTDEVPQGDEADLEQEDSQEDGQEDQAGDEGDEGWRGLPLEQEAVGEESEVDPWKDPLPVPAPETPRGSSKVFWIGAVAALVVIAAVSVYYFKFVRVPPEGHFGPIEIAAETAAPDPGPGQEAVDQASSAENPDAFSLGDSATAADSVIASAEAMTETEGRDQTPVDAAQLAEQQAEETILAQEEAGATLADEQPAPAPVFDMGPYEEPVGQKGWALHVYSFPDSASTLREEAELDRRGFRSAVRTFDLGEKGRWQRVYLGSFASRTEAKAAMPLLLEKLRVDWAKPERFSTSAPE